MALTHEISQCRRSEVNKVINVQSVDILCVLRRNDSAVFVAFFSSTFNTFNITTAGVFKLTRSVSVSVGHTDIIVDMWWTLLWCLELGDWKLKIIMWFWNEFQDDKFRIFLVFNRQEIRYCCLCNGVLNLNPSLNMNTLFELLEHKFRVVDV